MRQVFIYPGQMFATKDSLVITTILGSCVGIVLFDSKVRVSGLNHYLLADLPPGGEGSGRYGAYAIPELIQRLEELGASKKRLQARIYGGGQVVESLSLGKGVGARNIEIGRRLLAEAGIPIVEEDVGGEWGRKIRLNTESFAVECESMERKSGEDTSGNIIRAPKKRVKVGIVDDSVTVRSIFQKVYTQAGLDVVGVAKNAYEAREMIVQKDPDVLSLDIEMPEMSGVAFLEKLMIHKPMPVVMVSSLGSDSQAAVRALELGAVEFLKKPSQFDPGVIAELARTAAVKIRAAAATVVKKFDGPQERSASKSAVVSGLKGELELVVIGGNIGAQGDLEEILGQLPDDSPPVIVANATLAPLLASYLPKIQAQSAMTMKVASEGESLHRGTVYFLPESYHGVVKGRIGSASIRLQTGAPEGGQLPSASVLFESAAQVFGSGVVGVLLSGFGSDGLSGMEALQNRGALTIAVPPEETKCPYLPQNAICKGLATDVVSVDQIAPALMKSRSQRVA